MNYSGKDAHFAFTLDNQSYAFQSKTWKVKPEGVKVQDPVGGEDRDRIGFILNNFAIEIVLWMPDTTVVDLMTAYQDAKDAGAEDLNIGLGFRIVPPGKKAKKYVCTEACIDDWDWNAQPGRAERALFTMPLRARYFKPL